MGDNLDSAVNSLQEQTKKINIALHYTGNDMEKAKLMVAGSYKDLLACKVKFTSSSQYCVFLMFINAVQSRVMDSFFVVSNDYMVANIDNVQDWRLFEMDIATARANITDFRLVNEFKDKIDRAFTSAVCTSIVRLYEKDTTQLNHILQKTIQECTGLQRVDVSFEISKISSLEMELDAISTRKIDSMPKEELALIAETLVNITSFKGKISFAMETVGGPIDVLLITKGDGPVWVKRKNYFNPDINRLRW